MNRRTLTLCLLFVIGSLKSYSKDNYEAAYVKMNQDRAGAAAPTEVVKPRLWQAPEDLKVNVLLTVDSTGKVTKAKVLKSTDSRYNTEIKNAAKRWKVRPMTKVGEPVDRKVLVPFVAVSEDESLAMR